MTVKLTVKLAAKKCIGKKCNRQLTPLKPKPLFQKLNRQKVLIKLSFTVQTKYDKTVIVSIADATLLLGEYVTFLSNALMENHEFKDG